MYSIGIAVGNSVSQSAVGTSGVGCQRWDRQASVCLLRPSRPRTYRTVTSNAKPRKRRFDEFRWAPFGSRSNDSKSIATREREKTQKKKWTLSSGVGYQRERLKSPGRDERFSNVKTPDFATRVHFLVERGLRSAPMSWDRLDRCLGVYPIERPVVGDSRSCPQRMDLIGRAPSVPSVAMAVPCEILQRHHAACPCFSRQEYASEGGSRPAENS
ncbi:hypothetical protein Enr13x_18710 [Stieleria neptunia]|uniref:Uncharacterized protein n=1 Tax=Stieleria neptunia TaxID=2527979 RepID=A0A518HMH3_9BACT|nr:hypothetical protein Enr13x_18710 [Stieleria neptunia]